MNDHVRRATDSSRRNIAHGLGFGLLLWALVMVGTVLLRADGAAGAAEESSKYGEAGRVTRPAIPERSGIDGRHKLETVFVES